VKGGLPAVEASNRGHVIDRAGQGSGRVEIAASGMMIVEDQTQPRQPCRDRTITPPSVGLDRDSIPPWGEHLPTGSTQVEIPVLDRHGGDSRRHQQIRGFRVDLAEGAKRMAARDLRVTGAGVGIGDAGPDHGVAEAGEVVGETKRLERIGIVAAYDLLTEEERVHRQGSWRHHVFTELLEFPTMGVQGVVVLIE
jgi:hypothetical protein